MRTVVVDDELARLLEVEQPLDEAAREALVMAQEEGLMASRRAVEPRHAHTAEDRRLPFFYSDERQEPPHVHVEKGDGEAKLWLEAVRLAYSYRLTPAELRRVRELTFEHQVVFVERWNEHSRP